MSNAEKKDSKERTLSDRYLLKRIFPYVFQNKKLLFLGLLGIVIGSVLDVAGPYFVKIMIDDFVLQEKENGIILVGFLYLNVFFLNGITTYLRFWLLSIVGQNAIYQLRHDTFEKLQDFGMDYYDETPLGETLARLTSDLDNMDDLLSGQVLFAISSLGMIFAMVAVMLSVSPILTLIQLSTVILLIIVVYLRRRIERPRWSKFRETYGNLSAFMAENIAGARISLSFAREDFNRKEFEKHSQAFTDTHMQAMKVSAILWPFIYIFGALGTTLILLVGGSMIIHGNSDKLTAGTLVLFMAYQTQFIRPVMTLTNLYGTVQTSFASYELIVLIQDKKTSIVEAKDADRLLCATGEVEFRNIGFNYKTDTSRVLHNFNLRIRPNECLAIVGETGSGKTTIIRLLSRFYDFQEGEILIDGQNIRQVTLDSLRRCVGVVLQEPFLYSESIRYNLCYSRDIPDKELWKILSLIGATFVFDLPNGLDSTVGERGSRLSMGQRQLIAFARALVTNPKVLILDEATSSIDPQAELRIQGALAEMLKNRTSIIIAHRLSTVRAADRIIVLDNGKIVEEGAFDELLSKKGQFYDYYQMQFKSAQ
ncbi:MAG: ABC transporter ATP-binding protein [Candidatus Hodarchaeota archaeon]